MKKLLGRVRLFANPWNSPGQNTGVGSLSLLQGIFPTQGSNPGLPHCRQILYQLSHLGSPEMLVLALIRQLRMHAYEKPCQPGATGRARFSVRTGWETQSHGTLGGTPRQTMVLVLRRPRAGTVPAWMGSRLGSSTQRRPSRGGVKLWFMIQIPRI